MITQALIQKCIDLIKDSGPMKQHLEIGNEIGQMLASKLNADKNIVMLGTILMDCQVLTAIKSGKQSQHVQMSYDFAKTVLNADPDITAAEKSNVLSCILEHHGGSKFSSIESEICCNADCYRFASAQGFFVSLRYIREMLDSDLIKLLKAKVDEKSRAMTLDIVKSELQPQIDSINNLLKLL